MAISHRRWSVKILQGRAKLFFVYSTILSHFWGTKIPPKKKKIPTNFRQQKCPRLKKFVVRIKIPEIAASIVISFVPEKKSLSIWKNNPSYTYVQTSTYIRWNYFKNVNSWLKPFFFSGTKRIKNSWYSKNCLKFDFYDWEIVFSFGESIHWKHHPASTN